MGLFFERDNDIFFKDFGEVATLSNGNTFLVVVERTNDQEIFNPFMLSGEDITALCKVIDMETHSLAKGDVLTIDSIDYRITRIRKTNYSLGSIDLQYNED